MTDIIYYIKSKKNKYLIIETINSDDDDESAAYDFDYMT